MEKEKSNFASYYGVTCLSSLEIAEHAALATTRKLHSLSTWSFLSQDNRCAAFGAVRRPPTAEQDVHIIGSGAALVWRLWYAQPSAAFMRVLVQQATWKLEAINLERDR